MKVLLNRNQYTAAKLASDGLMNEEIARAMHKNKTSVDGYLHQVRELTGAKSRAEFWKWVYPRGPYAEHTLCAEDKDFVTFALRNENKPLSVKELKQITGFSDYKVWKSLRELKDIDLVRMVRVKFKDTNQIKYILERSKL